MVPENVKKIQVDSSLMDVSPSNERRENVFTVLGDASSDSESVPANP